MKMYNRVTVVALLGALLLSGCSTTSLEAVTDFDSTYSFSQVEKIAIQPGERMNAAAIRISDMDVNRLNEVFINELTAKGYEVVQNNADADMYLSWHLVTEEKTDVRSYNSMTAYNCWRCGPTVSDISVRQYTEGTLIVDMIDPGRAQSVWRSTVQSRLSSNVDAEARRALRTEAGRALFAELPPR